MAQIPVFQDGQVLQPSAPVQIGNADTTVQESVTGFGKALFTLGNELDRVNKKSKEEQDRTTIAILKSQYGKDMLLLRAQQATEAIKSDEPADGTGGVNTFNKNLMSVRQKYLKMLPGNLQEKFLAATGDDELENNVKVLADETKKRAENLPKIRQVLINEFAETARSNPMKLVDSLDEVENHILKDKTLPDIDKVAAVIDAKKQIARGFIDGFIQRGNEGQTAEFEQGRTFARDKLGLIFNPDELDKEIIKFNQAEIGYNNRVYTAEQRDEALRKRNFEANRQQALSLYTEQAKLAGNNQFDFNALAEKASADPRLTAEDKVNITRNKVFMETEDDQYEADIFTGINNKKLNINSATEKVNVDYNNGQVSVDRKVKILKALENIREFQRKDPTLERLVSQYYQRIDGLSEGTSVFDVTTGMYKGTFDRKNSIVKTDFANRLASLASEGRYTQSAIQAEFERVVGKSYPGEILATERNVRGSGKKSLPSGVKPELLQDATGIQKELTARAKEFALNKGKMTKEQLKEFNAVNSEYVKSLTNLNQKKKVEEITKPAPGKGKRYDE